MTDAREGHTATLLPSGKVLVAGGTTGSGPIASAELHDPASETRAVTGSLATARWQHTAALLFYLRHHHRFPFPTGAADRVCQWYSKRCDICNSHTTVRKD